MVIIFSSHSLAAFIILMSRGFLMLMTSRQSLRRALLIIYGKEVLQLIMLEDTKRFTEGNAI